MKKSHIITVLFVITMIGGGNSQVNNYQKTNVLENFDRLHSQISKSPELLENKGFAKRFGRHEFFWQHRVANDGSYQTYYNKLLQYSSGLNYYSTHPQAWENLGPRYVSNGNSGTGRTNSVWVNPNNPQHIKVGAASAGLWETTNGGDNWVNLIPHLPGGVKDFIVHPQNPNIVYGILEVHNNGMYHHWDGYGIFKSTNGGANAELLLTDIYTDHKGISEILFAPDNSNTIYVLTHHGVYVSTNMAYKFRKNLGIKKAKT